MSHYIWLGKLVMISQLPLMQNLRVEKLKLQALSLRGRNIVQPNNSMLL